MGNAEKPPKEADLATLSKIKKTFDRFDELSTENSVPQVSNRIKMLIKNMIDNRESGWERTKKQNEKGPMKVDELRKETERKLKEEAEMRMIAEQEEQAYLQGQGRGGRGKP